MAKAPTSKKPISNGVKSLAIASAKPLARTKPVATTKASTTKTVSMPATTRPVQPTLTAALAVDKAVVTKSVAPVQAVALTKEKTMTDTMTKVQETIKTNAQDATAKASAFFSDANGRTKDAMAKGTKAIEELVDFSKGNLEAMMSSGRIAAKGAEEIAKYSAEYGRAAVEKANATAKQFAAIKSPTEFFQLQGDVAKQTLDAVVSEGSKFTESYLKLLGEIVQPMQNRYAVAVEKVKTTVAA